ncbi:hypothetical protein PtA15_17A224 [Puccinia triticina]|nr:uncharacterized protein PtA15_17A224 [Puccinia triticina]WAQ92742.1 hypothetical protein PtA15_17A224 [Puccinia triticina]
MRNSSLFFLIALLYIQSEVAHALGINRKFLCNRPSKPNAKGVCMARINKNDLIKYSDPKFLRNSDWIAYSAKPSARGYTCQGVKFGSPFGQALFCCNLKIPPLNYVAFTDQEVTQNCYPA